MAIAGHFQYVTNDGDIVYMMTGYNAPKNKLIRVNLTDSDPSKWVDILPEHPTNILSDVVGINRNYVAAVYIENVSNVIKIFRLNDGKYVRDIPQPLGITIEGIKAIRDYADLYYKRTAFLMPEIIYKYDLISGESTVSLLDNDMTMLIINDRSSDNHLSRG